MDSKCGPWEKVLFRVCLHRRGCGRQGSCWRIIDIAIWKNIGSLICIERGGWWWGGGGSWDNVRAVWGERMSSGTQTFNSASVWDNRPLIIHLALCGGPLNIDSGAFRPCLWAKGISLLMQNSYMRHRIILTPCSCNIHLLGNCSVTGCLFWLLAKTSYDCLFILLYYRIAVLGHEFHLRVWC